MAKATAKPNKPSTIRFKAGVPARLDVQAKRQDRSRSYLINRYIEEGLARDERKKTAAAGGAFD